MHVTLNNPNLDIALFICFGHFNREPSATNTSNGIAVRVYIETMRLLVVVPRDIVAG
jgi:hypothetical protein